MGQTYHVDHKTKTTTYEDPRIMKLKEQASGQYASGKPPDGDPKTLRDLKASLQKWDIDPRKVTFKSKIGEGAFGEVWKATVSGLPAKSQVVKTDYMCAVKLLKDQEGKERQEKEIIDFLQEAKLMSTFDHPNVAKLLAVNTSLMPYLILSDYMNKGDLKKMLRDERLAGQKWPFDQKLLCAKQAAEGLKYLLVEKSFVHRDVAARNILVHEEMPGCLVCKLTDFGLSRDIRQSQYYRLTSAKETLLPIKWMSIESLDDFIFNHKTDVWSFGVLLWEIFSMGKIPYPSVDAVAMRDALERGLRLDKPKECIGPIYDLMLRCTSHSPNNRPAFPLICERLEEELAFATNKYNDVQARSEYGDIAAEDATLFKVRTASLSCRMSITEIKCAEDITELERDAIEDILHSNFVPFKSTQDVGELANELLRLWKETQQQDLECD
ncbi:fibroblast growth factor receptor 4-like [Corticium candelabrum]|uniref:fibroblast growth factor receptor 4-like n=1 Tax=Corticium candelabrum TaxID=121492 RepID=UPI002E2562D9|nr:fibroblast growth factor receptor 4-like [Corticium candelabrum]